MERPPNMPINRRMLRKTARRIAEGNHVVIGIANSVLAFKLKARALARIEAYYGRKVELLKEAEVLAVMEALHIKQDPLNAEEQTRLEELDRLEAEKFAENEAVTPQPAIQDSHFCTNCGARVNARARFCESCGTQLFF